MPYEQKKHRKDSLHPSSSQHWGIEPSKRPPLCRPRTCMCSNKSYLSHPLQMLMPVLFAPSTPSGSRFCSFRWQAYGISEIWFISFLSCSSYKEHGTGPLCPFPTSPTAFRSAFDSHRVGDVTSWCVHMRWNKVPFPRDLQTSFASSIMMPLREYGTC